MDKMVVCYLGLGSNLGNREGNIKLALRYLQALKETRVEKVSRFFDTEPQGCPPGTGKFLNAAAKIKTSLSPGTLLKKLKNIEVSLGRMKAKRNSSRVIDLDILFYANRKINLPNLVVPHPRLTMRDFVLEPLNEISPSLVKSLSKKIEIIVGINHMRQFLNKNKLLKKTIGFVPTMGYLHQGHLSLIRQAKKDCDVCVVSIFVNPAQFGPKEDYKKYPRDLERDSILARSAGCDVIFSPKACEMYPEGYSTYIGAEKLVNCLCGVFRPGHFRGVLTVVLKLLNIIQPDIAYFGQKDFQQALLIRKMVKDLNMPYRIKAMPIVRERDSLAMSSRNTYLSSQERIDAVMLYESLVKAKAMISSGQNNSQVIISMIKQMILSKKSTRIDYVSVASAETLEPLEYIKGKTLIALAVWVGKTRLIDNIVVRD